MLCTSIIHHSKYDEEKYPGKRLVGWLDRAMAHIVYIAMAYIVVSHGVWNVWISGYVLCALGVVGIYYLCGVCMRDDLKYTHALMHVLVTIGTICFMYGVYVVRS